MKKYIDADKLYKKVDALMAHYAEAENAIEDDVELSIFYQGKRKMCSEIIALIESLQQEQPSFPTIKCWVARDDYEFRHGCLHLYITKPCSDGNYGWRGRAIKELDTHLLPDLKWIDGPIEVELIIRKK